MPGPPPHLAFEYRHIREVPRISVVAHSKGLTCDDAEQDPYFTRRIESLHVFALRIETQCFDRVALRLCVLAKNKTLRSSG